MPRPLSIMDGLWQHASTGQDDALGHILSVWQSVDGMDRVHCFDEIPTDCDILLTHGPPFSILDRWEFSWDHWGGSKALLEAILRAKPRVHLFGHCHDQRGYWSRKPTGDFEGMIEYQLTPGMAWKTFEPPAIDYPVDLSVCSAMLNHVGMETAYMDVPHLEGAAKRMWELRDAGVKIDKGSRDIAGPAHLIVAQRAASTDSWIFLLEKAVPSTETL